MTTSVEQKKAIERNATPSILTISLQYLRTERYGEEIPYSSIASICKKVKRPKSSKTITSPSAVERVINGVRRLYYRHLEHFHYFFCIPSGVILSCSRATSELSKGQYDNAKELGQGLIDLGEAIKAQSNNISSGKQEYNEVTVLKALFDAYEEKGFRPIHYKITPDKNPYLKQIIGKERYQEFLKKFLRSYSL